MSESLKSRTAKGLMWSTIGVGGLQLFNVLFGLYLSRILTPADYGMVGSLAIFSGVAGMLSQSGFTLALVNKRDITDADYNAVFWFSIAMSVAMYALMFAIAPLIAAFYHQPAMTWLSRFIFIAFCAGGIAMVPTAYMMRNLLVKQRNQNLLISVALSGTIGVICATYGWGYWGLAMQTVTYSSALAVLMWVRCPWRPTRSFSPAPLKEMFPFSIRQLLTSLFTLFNNNLFATLLGRFYSMSVTGFYTQGNKWTALGYWTLTETINGVGQPVLREAGAERDRLQRVFYRLFRFALFMSLPVMAGLALCARELIVITVTDKWLAAVPIMQVLCVWGVFAPVTTLYSNLFNSLQRPGVCLWNNIALGTLQILGLIMCVSMGLMTMLYVYTALNVIWVFVWQYYAHRYTGLSLARLIRSSLPYVSAALIALFLALALTLYLIPAFTASLSPLGVNIFILLTKGFTFITVYLLVVYLASPAEFKEYISFLRHRK